MTTWQSSASALADTDAGVAFATGGNPAANFFWPVWRFGRVLLPVGAESLPVSDAQQIGSLFGPGKPAASRYHIERTAELWKMVDQWGGSYLRDWPQYLRYGTGPYLELEKKWHPEEILISYSFVPIIRLPQFIVEIRGGCWQVRESLTVCGSPAKSKAWITASLIAYNGQPTETAPLSKADLGEARRAFGPFAQASLVSLIAFYQKVLNEDTRSLSLEAPLHIHALKPVAETEIVSMASGVRLGAAFDQLEVKGFRRFCSEAGQSQEGREVLDFLEWTDSIEIPGAGEWQRGRPKILAIYAEEPACGSIRALVIPRIHTEQNRTWYAALTEQRTPPNPTTHIPLSESAGRSLAKEYGRYF
jgi:hypothetical protein